MIAVGALGLVAVATATLWVTSRTQQAGPRCDLGKTELARVWNPTVRGTIGAAFTASKISYAPSTWAATAQLIDDYGTRWAGEFDAACAATHIKRVQPPAVLDLRAQCLDRRRVELAAVLDVLAKPDAVQVDMAPNAVGSLLSPQACADAELLAATEPVPDAPEVRKRVTAARANHARVEALAASGKYQDALVLARQVSATATKLGYAPLIAEIDSRRGRIALDIQAWDEAKTALDNALLAAERGRHHWMRGDVQLALAYLAIQRNNPTQALAELERADALVTGLGNADPNRARVEDYRATALAQLGKLDEAKDAATKAIALYESGEGADTISLANPLTQLAFVNYQRDDLPAAVKLLERALAIQLKVFGADHPRIGTAHTNLAFNYSASDRLDDATKSAQTARTIFAKSLGEDSEPYTSASRALVGILIRRADYPQAERIAREIVVKLRKHPQPDQKDISNALDDLAAAVVAQKRMDEGLSIRQEVLQLREKVYPAGHPTLVSSWIDVGEVLADLERCDEALKLYDRAQPHTDGKDMPPYLAITVRLGRGRCLVELKRFDAAIPPLREALSRGDNPQHVDDRKLRAGTRFVLAQALWGKAERTEALELAEAAKAEADQIADTVLAAAIATWLAAR